MEGGQIKGGKPWNLHLLNSLPQKGKRKEILGKKSLNIPAKNLKKEPRRSLSGDARSSTVLIEKPQVRGGTKEKGRTSV